jgi:3-oxoacyl-[acyl-carrier-protein] synthase II
MKLWHPAGQVSTCRSLDMKDYTSSRIVITGIGLTSPNGNSLSEFRENLLSGTSRVSDIDIRYMGKVHAGVCDYDARKYQTRRELRNSTRAGSIAIYCSRESIADAGIDWEGVDTSRVGGYIGTTEHGNVETENEVYNISQYEFWSHHHNPRTVANNPAGEVTMNLGIHGPHYTIGAACAAGNAGIIQGYYMLKLGEVDMALAGGVSESIHTFGIFASFKSQGALAVHEDPTKASRPFDAGRNGIVVSEGGAVYTLERLEDAQARGARIYAEVVGHHINSDATDAVLPNSERQMQCMQAAMAKAGLTPADIDIVNTHATSTPQGDIQECMAIRELFPPESCPNTRVNNTKSYIGHAMGAAGALELAGNIPAFEDGIVHPTINVDQLDPECALPNLVINEPEKRGEIRTILNNSFGMLGINSCLIVKKFAE